MRVRFIFPFLKIVIRNVFLLPFDETEVSP